MNPPSSTAPVYLTTHQAAEIINLSVAWLERMRWAGGGPPYVKLSKAVRYPLDELNAWMRSRIRTSTTEEA